jgi:hypothetical protein
MDWKRYMLNELELVCYFPVFDSSNSKDGAMKADIA